MQHNASEALTKRRLQEAETNERQPKIEEGKLHVLLLLGYKPQFAEAVQSGEQSLHPTILP
jgi:hypothetical protein